VCHSQKDKTRQEGDFSLTPVDHPIQSIKLSYESHKGRGTLLVTVRSYAGVVEGSVIIIAAVKVGI
jgi:hypothetical protein